MRRQDSIIGGGVFKTSTEDVSGSGGATTLAALTDTSLGTPGAGDDGKLLGYNHAGTNYTLRNPALNQLSDVDTAGATTGQLLTRKADGSYNFQSAPGGSNALNDLTDVNVGTPGAGDNGKFLKWNNGAGEFDLGAVATALTWATMATSATAAVNNHVLVTGNSVVVTLPSASTTAGTRIVIQSAGTGTSISSPSALGVVGGTSLAIPQGAQLTVVTDGSTWYPTFSGLSPVVANNDTLFTTVYATRRVAAFFPYGSAVGVIGTPGSTAYSFGDHTIDVTAGKRYLITMEIAWSADELPNVAALRLDLTRSGGTLERVYIHNTNVDPYRAKVWHVWVPDSTGTWDAKYYTQSSATYNGALSVLFEEVEALV